MSDDRENVGASGSDEPQDQQQEPTGEPEQGGGPIFTGPPPPPERRIGKATLILVLVLLAAIGTGVALVLAGGSQDEALDALLPADVAVYGSVSLRPSGSQGDKLKRLLERFPASKRAEIQRAILDDFNDSLKDGGLPLDWQRDFAPWVDDRIAITFSPNGTSDAPNVVLVMTVREVDKARSTLTRLKDKAADEGDAFDFAMSGNVAYVAPRQSYITSLQNRAKTASLATSATFQRARERVGGEGLAFVWVDGTRLGQAIRSSGAVPGATAGLFGQALTGFSASVQAQDNGLSLVARGKVPPGFTPGSGAPRLLESTTSGQIGSFTLFDLGGLAEYGLNVASNSAQAQGIDQSLEAFQQFLGIDLKKDLVPWLHGEFSVVFGGLGREGPNVGAVIQPTDAAAARRTLDALRTRLPALASQFGAPVTARSVRGGFALRVGDQNVFILQGTGRVVIATPEAYARSLLGSAKDKLGDDAIYRRAVSGTSQKVSGQMYLRLDRIASLIKPFLSGSDLEEYETNVEPILSVIKAIGIRSTIDGDEQETRALLVFADS